MLKPLKIAFLFLLPTVLSGQVLAEPRQYNFPITDVDAGDLSCYMVSRSGNTLDLARLCGSVRSINYNGQVTGTGGAAITPRGLNGQNAQNRQSSSNGGICNTPDDIARDGSRCGGRAASERQGGRTGTENNSGSSSSGGILNREQLRNSFCSQTPGVPCIVPGMEPNR